MKKQGVLSYAFYAPGLARPARSIHPCARTNESEQGPPGRPYIVYGRAPCRIDHLFRAEPIVAVPGNARPILETGALLRLISKCPARSLAFALVSIS